LKDITLSETVIINLPLHCHTTTYPNVEGEMLTKERVLREKRKQWLMGCAILRLEDNKIRAQYILHVARKSDFCVKAPI
jgi:hypothetical protein